MKHVCKTHEMRYDRNWFGVSQFGVFKREIAVILLCYSIGKHCNSRFQPQLFNSFMHAELDKLAKLTAKVRRP